MDYLCTRRMSTIYAKLVSKTYIDAHACEYILRFVTSRCHDLDNSPRQFILRIIVYHPGKITIPRPPPHKSRMNVQASAFLIKDSPGWRYGFHISDDTPLIVATLSFDSSHSEACEVFCFSSCNALYIVVFFSIHK